MEGGGLRAQGVRREEGPGHLPGLCTPAVVDGGVLPQEGAGGMTGKRASALAAGVQTPAPHLAPGPRCLSVRWRLLTPRRAVSADSANRGQGAGAPWVLSQCRSSLPCARQPPLRLPRPGLSVALPSSRQFVSPLGSGPLSTRSTGSGARTPAEEFPRGTQPLPAGQQPSPQSEVPGRPGGGAAGMKECGNERATNPCMAVTSHR